MPVSPRRASARAGVLAAVLLVGWCAAAGHAWWSRHGAHERQAQARALVRALDLTDMAWFTEARYTRHPALADLHSAFQDGPGAPEHFPAGTLMPPPWRHAGVPVAPPDTDRR
ncbi:hypothetical protein [Hydrogenophaga sp.]|uniref:hypothetical protein n=1 Tax=Hydrogenophaga sp. TaxID=1904254 RepID=UPI0035B115A8